MSSDCCALKNSSLFFSENELASISPEFCPKHVAIIMDGNRRWAQKQSFSKVMNPFSGHWAGAKTLITITEAAIDLGIKVLTVYAFSTENWSRSSQEVETLFYIFDTFLKENEQKMIKNGIRFDVIGDLTPFSASLKKKIRSIQFSTQNGEALRLVVAINYGGRDEIARAIRLISGDLEKGIIKKNEINEELIAKYLDTAAFGDPDLLIRTSGELRISNFLLWQLAYTEVYISDILWPDFTPRELLLAVLEFQKRQRRMGR